MAEFQEGWLKRGYIAELIANVYSRCDRAGALLCSCFSKLSDFLTVHIGQWGFAEPRTDHL